MTEVIDLDCDDIVTDNNEIENIASNTKESNVSQTSTPAPEIENETIPEEKTDDITEVKTVDIQTSSANSSQDLDKFKRRLIRVIARSLVMEKMPEAKFWKELKNVTSCDCQVLWTRMRAVTIKKLKRLLIVEDKIFYITKIARPSITDWLLIDLVLVHQKVDVIGQEEQFGSENKKEPKALEYLFKYVLKYNVEKLSGDELIEAWVRIAKDYNKNGRYCSPMLLQRRWYQLKELVWYNFYNFWFSYRGKSGNLANAKQFQPSPLQMEITKHYSEIITEQFQTWEELIENKKVALLEDFELYELARKRATVAENEPDLVVIEPHVETIDLRVESDSDGKDDDNDDASDTNEGDDSKVNLSKVKNETDSDEEDVSILEGVNIPLESLKSSNDRLDEKISKDTQKNENVNNIILSDSDKVISDSDEVVTDSDDEDVVILSKLKDKNELAKTKDTPNEQSENNDSLGKSEKKVVLTEDRNKSSEQTNNNESTVGSAHDVCKMTIPIIKNVRSASIESEQNIQHEDHVTQDTEDKKLNERTSFESVVDISKEKGLTTNEIIDLDEETPEPPKPCVNVPEKQNVNILYDVTSNIGVYMDDLELEDDGIEYIEEDDEEDATEIVDKAENKIQEESSQDSPKIDLKLLLQTVVYTKRLNDMDVFRFIDYTSVKDARVINDAILESSPVDRKSFKVEDISECPKKDESDVSEDDFSNDDDDSHKAVNYKSWYFEKPKISSYNPIQLCKNPDFNTRLKRLTPGFFSYERNRELLKKCKPMTIDIYKSFEKKLHNNSLLLNGFSSQTIKTEFVKPIVKTEEPTVLPCDSLSNSSENILDTSNQILPLPLVCDSPDNDEAVKPRNAEENKECNLPSNSNQVEPQVVERNKVINLPDINQIRRANERLLIAEVTPIQACTTNKSPVEMLQPIVYTQSINEQSCQNIGTIQNVPEETAVKHDISNAGEPQPSVTQKHNKHNKTEKLQSKKVEMTKKSKLSGLNTKSKKIVKEASEKPSFKPPTKVIRELVRKGIPTDRLLTLDTVKRIMSICMFDNTDFKGKKAKKRVLKSISQDFNKNLQREKVVDVAPFPAVDEVKQNNMNTKKKTKKKEKKRIIKKPTRTIYCCWAREKLVSLSKLHPRLVSPHTCPIPICNCCCQDDYIKKLREIHGHRLNPDSYNLFTDSIQKQSSEPLLFRKVETTSRGINTDYDPEYSLNLLEASKIPCGEVSNKHLQTVQQCLQPSYDVSVETPASCKTFASCETPAPPETLTLSQDQQIQTEDVSLDNTSVGLNPIITNVLSLARTHTVKRQSEIQNDPSQMKCKTNVLYALHPSYLTPPKDPKQITPEFPGHPTVVNPDNKFPLINNNLQKITNSISLGKNKFLLCSMNSKDEIKTMNEINPPQVVMLNEAPEAVTQGSIKLTITPNNQLTLAIEPMLNVNSCQLENTSPTTFAIEQQIPKDVSNPDSIYENTCQIADKFQTPINASYINVSNESPIVDDTEMSEEIIDISNDENTEDLVTPNNFGTLDQAEPAVEIRLECREQVAKSPTCDQNDSINTNTLDLERQILESNKSSHQNETSTLKRTEGSTNKTILSDLMEMSGISIEDTTVNNVSTELAANVAKISACRNNATEKETSAIHLDTISLNPNDTNAAVNNPTNNELGALKLDLNVISSYVELKQAFNKKRQFYKIDVETGKIIPINVNIKKHNKIKSKPILPNTVIDLTDDSENGKDIASNPLSDDLKQPEIVIQPETVVQPKTIRLDILKKLEIVKPMKLFKAVHKTVLKGSGKSILKKHITSEAKTLNQIRQTLTQIRERKRKGSTRDEIKNGENNMENDENVKTNKIEYSDSDDEPLALKAKRKKNVDNCGDKSEDKPLDNISQETETVQASTSSGADFGKPEKNVSADPVLEPVVFNDSSDEDCILGV